MYFNFPSLNSKTIFVLKKESGTDFQDFERL